LLGRVRFQFSRGAVNGLEQIESIFERGRSRLKEVGTFSS